MVTTVLAAFLLLVSFERAESCAGPPPAPSPPNPSSKIAPPATGPVKNVSSLQNSFRTDTL